jgi:uncharacterized membrane protein YbhN (UPF0104 family)
MLNVLRSLNKALDDIIGWRRLGYVVSAAVILFSLSVLYRFLKDVRGEEVVAALKRTDAHDLMLAGLCLAGVFLTLTLYDFFALRTIGRCDVPYHAAALSSFASFSIGHNIGAVLVASAAIRFRIYSAWGLGAVEVLKVCFVTGLTFWLGNAVVLGLAVSFRPDAASAINQLAPEINRGVAMAALSVIILYLFWLAAKPRIIGIGNWTITLPGPRLTLVQIAIGFVDLTLCSLAMYFLMPDTPGIEFPALLVIFLTATLLGFLSHAPSGLGVFDAAMLVGLHQFETGELVASLLLFRFLYYLLPLTAALTFLGVREMHRAWPRRPQH